MGSMLLFVIGCIVCVVLCTVFYTFSGEAHRRNNALIENVNCILSVTFGIVAFVFICLLIGWVATYPGAQARFGNLTGMRDSLVAYEVIARDTKTAYYVVEQSDLKLGNQPIVLGLENVKQSTNVSDRLARIGELILDYNMSVSKYRSNWSNWFTKMFIPKPPDDLKPIIVKSDKSFLTPEPK